MLTAERTCNLCDGTLEYIPPEWAAWFMRVEFFKNRGLSERTAQLMAGPMPDEPQVLPCPVCHWMEIL